MKKNHAKCLSKICEHCLDIEKTFAGLAAKASALESLAKELGEYAGAAFLDGDQTAAELLRALHQVYTSRGVEARKAASEIFALREVEIP